jgi:hypothetical protein
MALFLKRPAVLSTIPIVYAKGMEFMQKFQKKNQQNTSFNLIKPKNARKLQKTYILKKIEKINIQKKIEN